MEKVISAIKVQKRNHQRVSIDLDGEYAFGLSRLTAAWLKVGNVLSEERIAALQQEDALEIAYQRALRLIDHRPRSEKEIRQKLAEKDFSAGQIDQAVEKLQRAGLIQDGEFARMWVENRNEFHPRSKRLMRYELLNKGIAEEHIEAALEGSTEDSELALRAGLAYARRLTACDQETFRKRLSGYLARRGFTYGTIVPVVSQLWQQQGSTEVDTNITNEEV